MKARSIFFVLAQALVWISCTKDLSIMDYQTPGIENLEIVYNVDEQRLRFRISVSNPSRIEREGIMIDDNSSFSSPKKWTAECSGAEMTIGIPTSDLEPGKKYYCRPFITNGRNDVPGSATYFIIPSSSVEPVVYNSSFKEANINNAYYYYNVEIGFYEMPDNCVRWGIDDDYSTHTFWFNKGKCDLKWRLPDKERLNLDYNNYIATITDADIPSCPYWIETNGGMFIEGKAKASFISKVYDSRPSIDVIDWSKGTDYTPTDSKYTYGQWYTYTLDISGELFVKHTMQEHHGWCSDRTDYDDFFPYDGTSTISSGVEYNAISGTNYFYDVYGLELDNGVIVKSAHALQFKHISSGIYFSIVTASSAREDLPAKKSEALIETEYTKRIYVQ